MIKNTVKSKVFQGRVVILGFGCIGQAVLPLLLQDLKIKPSQIIVLSKSKPEVDVAKKFNVLFINIELDVHNYVDVLDNYFSQGDFLLNLSTGISSQDLILFCKTKGALYLDASTEPWEGVYIDEMLEPERRTNYSLREEVLRLERKGPTAILTHGANPGLVSHFVKQALLNLAQDNDLFVKQPHSREEWAELAQKLNIKSIHIAERDTQVSSKLKLPNVFFNTWSIEGLLSESLQPAELSWGTHEQHWPLDAKNHDWGSQCAIYLNCPGVSVRVRTWTPSGPTHGYLITHAESMSIANYLTIQKDSHVIYRPTVHYAYSVSSQTKLSLFELMEREYTKQDHMHLMMDDVTEGYDELGVLLMGNPKGAYWYGSILSIDEAKKIADYNNATSLQVVAGVIAAMTWAIEHPEEGILEPEDLNFQTILEYATPYLGTVKGFYTDWTPLQGRSQLFDELLNEEDPWQFLNVRV